MGQKAFGSPIFPRVLESLPLSLFCSKGEILELYYLLDVIMDETFDVSVSRRGEEFLL